MIETAKTVSPDSTAPSRPRLEGFADKAVHIPFLGIFSAFVKDWIPLIDEYYYCACSSQGPIQVVTC